VLVADALLGIRVFDISPGEMFFESLDSYSAQSHAGLPALAMFRLLASGTPSVFH
jgi:hypothetical protein